MCIIVGILTICYNSFTSVMKSGGTRMSGTMLNWSKNYWVREQNTKTWVSILQIVWAEMCIWMQAQLRCTSRPNKNASRCSYSAMPPLTLARIEIMTFDLCHVYSRASRAISQPAPSFYAHLAAFRCRYYVHQGDDGNFRVAPLNDRLRSVMFYG